MEAEAKKLLKEIGLSYDVKQPLSIQGAAVAQMVAIARALADVYKRQACILPLVFTFL